MATDARIATGLPSHPKTKKLVRRLGAGAGWSLVCLFLWAAANRSDGDLAGMSTEDIELAADWDGDDGAFVREISQVHFLDGQEGAYRIHDWGEHNPWAAGAYMRSLKAKWNAAKRHHGAAEADRLVPEYAAVRSAGSNADDEAAACAQHATSMLAADSSNAPFPFPFPSPSPFPSHSPSLRSGECAAKPLRTSGRKKSEAKTLAAYLADCKASGAKPVPDDHHVRRWAEDAGFQPDMLQIAWVLFRDRYTEGEKGKGKRYLDWPAHFATAVKDNWFKLWFADGGAMNWTSQGLTHKTVLDARMAQREADHAPA